MPNCSVGPSMPLWAMAILPFLYVRITAFCASTPVSVFTGRSRCLPLHPQNREDKRINPTISSLPQRQFRGCQTRTCGCMSQVAVTRIDDFFCNGIINDFSGRHVSCPNGFSNKYAFFFGQFQNFFCLGSVCRKAFCHNAGFPCSRHTFHIHIVMRMRHRNINQFHMDLCLLKNHTP